VLLDSALGERRVLRLAPQDYSFTLEFAALNFRDPDKNRYAYRLDGFDSRWMTTGSRPEATYVNLDPGTYTFRVRAANNDGVWNRTGATLRVVVAPAWYQTWWFRSLVGLALAGLLYLAYRVRVRQLLALAEVRQSIARDLHDDMGSTLSSIAMLSQLARTHFSTPHPERAAALVARIGDSAHRTLDAMDDIVWSITPAHDSLDKVIARMRGFASEVLEAQDIDLAFRVGPGVAGLKLPMRTRREFYLLFKEAINNLAKYARCQNATIALTHTGAELVLTVQDDGVGFDPATPALGGGNGLANMRARAEAMRGSFSLTSVPGQGTALRLGVPVRRYF
jgi:signal transduction histidine kinase